MPPPSSDLNLTDRQRQLLQQWIQSGAAYQQHWAFQPVERPDIPEDTSRHPVDVLIDRRLNEAGLTRADAASRYTLIRPVFLDVTGLPPTPAETRQYVEDEQKETEKLLGSPRRFTRWGECGQEISD